MLKSYTVYFEIFGKKMRTKVLADSESQAKDLVKDRITWHRVVEDKEATKYAKDILGDMFSAFGFNQFGR